MKKIIIRAKMRLPLDVKIDMVQKVKSFLDSKENDVLLVDEIFDIVCVDAEDVIIIEDT